MSQDITVSLLHRDLEKSGLVSADLDAYTAEEAELSAVGLKPYLYLRQSKNGSTAESPGYIIPYFDIDGRRLPFYRLRLFNPLPKGAKYLQPKESGTFIYFPKDFAKNIQRMKSDPKGPNIILITEGEKKAAKACKEGFACCAVGGIYNWRSRTLSLTEDAKVVKLPDNSWTVKLPKQTTLNVTVDRKGFLAQGLSELIMLIKELDACVVIVFDSDYPAKKEVAEACAKLAFELRLKGIELTKIRRLSLLPAGRGQEAKLGLDDYLVQFGANNLQQRINSCLQLNTAFPLLPNIKEMINDYLAQPYMTRAEIKELSLVILSDMDQNGARMMDINTHEPYYFDAKTRKLMLAGLLRNANQPLHETPFGQHLYRRYDIGQGDPKLVHWLAAGFTGEQPVHNVEPRSILSVVSKDEIAYQLNDGQYVSISGNQKTPATLHLNGTNGILFRANQVVPISGDLFMEEFQAQLRWLDTNPKYDEYYWVQALKQMNFIDKDDIDLLATLYYASPWLFRWRGTQLPIEIMIGEAGSGKSSIYALRLHILTGYSALRNQPTDIRDWYASILAQEGLHAIDNAHILNKEMRQRLSDEMCRLVTEPEPFIEMRKLFTTSENYRVPARTVFAITAIQQPFQNSDLLQRAIVTELQAISTNFQTSWFEFMLDKFGGRVRWLAHELAVLHVFLRKANAGWDSNFKSNHRLANFEQTYQMMGAVLNSPNASRTASGLSNKSADQVSEYDWVMSGLKDYAYYRRHIVGIERGREFTLQEVSIWAEAIEDYATNIVLCSPRRLARYVKTHKAMIERSTGITEAGKKNNRDTYTVAPTLTIR